MFWCVATTRALFYLMTGLVYYVKYAELKSFFEHQVWVPKPANQLLNPSGYIHDYQPMSSYQLLRKSRLKRLAKKSKNKIYWTSKGINLLMVTSASPLIPFQVHWVPVLLELKTNLLALLNVPFVASCCVKEVM